MSFPDPYDDAVERELELAAKRRRALRRSAEKCSRIGTGSSATRPSRARGAKNRRPIVTVAEAKKALEPPLVFGNEAQIKAVRFLEEVEACCAAIRACDDFEQHKDDELEANEETLDEDESGKTFWRVVKACGCGDSFKDDVLRGVLYQLAGEIYA